MSVLADRTGYSPVQIILHWTIAALVVFQLLFGESMGAVIDAASGGATASAADQQMATLHYWVGIAVLVLAAFRLGVRLTHGAPPLVGLSPLTVQAARLTHTVFYLC